MFNKALAWQNEQYEQDNHHKFSYTKLANLLPHGKKNWYGLKMPFTSASTVVKRP
nr:hypothetical protein [Pasteurella multocida]